MTELILKIALIGLEFLSDERKTKIQDEHHELLEDLRNAQNATGENYYDGEIDIADEKLTDFLTAFATALEEEKNETND